MKEGREKKKIKWKTDEGARTLIFSSQSIGIYRKKGDYGNWPVYDLDAYHVHICIMYITFELVKKEIFLAYALHLTTGFVQL